MEVLNLMMHAADMSKSRSFTPESRVPPICLEEIPDFLLCKCDVLLGVFFCNVSNS